MNDIDTMMENAGYYDDAASKYDEFGGRPHPDSPQAHTTPRLRCGCHLRGGKRAYCSHCIRAINNGSSDDSIKDARRIAIINAGGRR